MARSKQHLGAEDITAVWIAPEALRAERIQAAVEAGASSQEVADLAVSPPLGEFRESLGDEKVDGVITAKFGDRLVWVHPEGDDAGRYERYTGADEDYQPVLVPAAKGA